MRSTLHRFRWPIVALGVGLIVFVAVWFQPQTLFIDQVVDQALPEAAPPAADSAAPPEEAADPAGSDAEDGVAEAAPEDETDGADEPGDAGDAPATEQDGEEAPAPQPSGPVDLATGEFGSLGRYTTVGDLRIVELEDGRRFVRLENFETSNGPDLFVYLSNGAADGSTGFTDEFVDLGDLQGNIGDQNYEIDPDVDLSLYQSVVIYCLRFNSPFGAAEIQLTS